MCYAETPDNCEGIRGACFEIPMEMLMGSSQSATEDIMHGKWIDLYAGTYADAGSEGIHLFRVSPVTGDIEHVAGFATGGNPSWLAVDHMASRLYAVNEVDDFGGRSGGVSAFSIDGAGGLALLGQVDSGGACPCYISLVPGRRCVLVANYYGGNAALLPLHPDGSLAEPASIAQHHGAGSDPDRQDSPHVHCIIPDPAGRFALASDLGTDRIVVYRLGGHLLRPVPEGGVAVKGGAGPRHLAIHPNGRFVYIATELDSTVITCSYDPGEGRLRELGTVSTLPAGFAGESHAAGIQVSPGGTHLYVSNRGDDSIAVFRIDAGSGEPDPLGHVPSGGRTPRGFGLDPAGRLLVVANQDSGTLVAFLIDHDSGMPVASGGRVEVDVPACVVMRPAM